MLRLVVDNTDRHAYLADLLRAVMWNANDAPLPDDLKGLLLAIDEATIEDDLVEAHARGMWRMTG